MKLHKLIALTLGYLCTLSNAQDDEPSIPSHMPSPPKESSSGGGRSRPDRENHNQNQGGGGNGGGHNGDHGPGSNHFSEIPPNPPPQNAPVGPGGPAGGEEITQAPFGLDHIILILVPQFKTRLLHLPKWMGSNVKFSLPMTVFFDKLKFPPPPRPISSPFYGPYFPNGHYVKKRSVVVERFDTSIYGAERVTLIPRLEKLLASFGLGGRSCLLRTICEVHEFPMEHHGYGLLGEVLTLFFSISRSGFADSHLLEYLKAEEFGKYGDCSMYYEECPESLFYWEKVHSGENDVEAEAELMFQFL